MLTFLHLLARLASDFVSLPRKLTDSFYCRFWSHEQNLQVQLHGVKIRSNLRFITITYLTMFFFLRRSSSTVLTMPFSNLPAGRGYTHNQPIRKGLCVVSGKTLVTNHGVLRQGWVLETGSSFDNMVAMWRCWRFFGLKDYKNREACCSGTDENNFNPQIRI